MITRDNYEEFFLLYTDNELSEAERHEVERFVAGHPDLREEWETLLQCKLSPDPGLSFSGREALLKPEIEGSAYTGALLSYIDGELTTEERTRIEAVILDQPRVAIELAVLRQTISRPDPAILFPEKDRLYKPEKDRRIIPLPWLRAGIAAAIAGTIALLLLLPSKRPMEKPASANIRHRDSIIIAHKFIAPVTPAPATALHSMEGYPRTQKDRPAQQLIHRRKPQQQNVAANDNQDIAANDNRDLRPTTAPGIVDPVATHIATDAIGSIPPKEDARANVQFAVQTGIPKAQSSFATQALQDEADDQRNNNFVTAEPAAPGRTALRSIFRKLKRTLGKTADRDDDGNRQVLVGAFQVSLD
jgi:hypothetical protein